MHEREGSLCLVEEDEKRQHVLFVVVANGSIKRVENMLRLRDFFICVVQVIKFLLMRHGLVTID